MEQRAWKRDSIALNVEVSMWRPGGVEVVKCKTLDISLGGAELLTFDVTFPKHRVLELRFSQMSSTGLKQPRILAKFIRKTNHGMAIQFCKAHNETLKKLQFMMLKDKLLKTKISQLKYGLG